ncbi:hypothetical protein [Burkholderia glumae]|uniref:Secreted protein n=1 Tax=Burkholderia glumae TaxID=337 RepID=A0AAP9Y1C1_BURGL|nr:hypothetical protein [Burkholderia glumae]ACR31483.1 Hypothetical protein bglu_2g10850 [Burkholderia glumae BGR1]AJY64787.1 hypothetical protein KS03_4835 [Burkholderia glumae LMG 2196 = ATCC 33617]KHJ61309.1 hypothetical protein NCPPB3923_19455 [Burkholderia glumae]MCM2485354.1 hypothetical protein [Burkholderia glumae]MCM2495760.1 hypothetical protein [Burkholderia glumae]
MRIAELLCAALLGGAVPLAHAAGADCLTQAEVTKLDTDFWAKFPSPDGFAAYAAPDMRLDTNIVDLMRPELAKADGPTRARSFAVYASQHPEYFAPFRTEHSSHYLYYPGRDRHPDAVKQASVFPANRCVSMFSFDDERHTCIAGARTRAMSFSFVKENGRVQLQGIEVGMEACQP